MGCAGSTTVNQKLIVSNVFHKGNVKQDSYLNRKQHFESFHKKFKEEIVNMAFMEELDQLDKLKNENLVPHINKLFIKYKNQLDKAKINKDIFTNLIYEVLSETFIKNQFLNE